MFNQYYNQKIRNGDWGLGIGDWGFGGGGVGGEHRTPQHQTHPPHPKKKN